MSGNGRGNYEETTLLQLRKANARRLGLVLRVQAASIMKMCDKCHEHEAEIDIWLDPANGVPGRICKYCHYGYSPDVKMRPVQ